MQNCPAVLNYVTRIGAEQCSFRKWQVREFKGQYYWEKVYIQIRPDGSVDYGGNPDYAPTDQEAAEIKRQWDENLLPKVVPARDTSGIKLHTPGSILYEFYDAQGRIIFVQERCEPKAYLPWTFWSDGEWRCMHPEDKYPFFRPKKRTKLAKIMVHEGAKAADFCNNLPEDHPWYNDLKDYEHWGIIGGALAVNRADFAFLRSMKVHDVVYVCDNDLPGKSVLQQFSRQYGLHLTGIQWDARFKPGFDLGDPLPDEFFNSDGEWIGPDLFEFSKPATFATELVYPEKGKPYPQCRRAFLEEWIHCVTPEAFIHKDWPARIYGKAEFNNTVSPFSHADDTARLVVKDDASKGYLLKYDPSRPTGIFVSEEGQCINTHQPSKIKRVKGSVKPFLDFMEHLIPIPEDRHQVLRWCATLLAHPEIKINYGLLLVSETQGVGKGTLGERILAPLVGKLNVSFPSEEDITEGSYNYWQSHKRLAVVHEIYAGHSSKAYNKLKSVITDRNLPIKKKYMADYTIDNWLHIFACSNSPRALKLSLDDRRWLVPKVTDEKPTYEYWQKLHDWLQLKHGLGKILNWAHEWEDIIYSGEEAPRTETKKHIIEETYSPGQELVHSVLRALKEERGGERIIIADKSLIQLIRNVLYEGRQTDKLERAQTLRTIARNLGYFISKHEHANVKAWGMVERPRLICMQQADAATSPGSLAEEGLTPFDVEAFYRSVARV